MTDRTCYDSTTVADLPAGGDLYLGYVDGLYKNKRAIQERFPDKKVVGVTVTGATIDAEVADVETGDLTAQSGAAWAKRKIANGQHPTLYTYAANWGAVRQAVAAAGIAAGEVSYFIADYDGNPTIPSGAVAKQYRSSDAPAGTAGHCDGHKDISAVRAYWPGVDPPRLTRAQRIAQRLHARRADVTRVENRDQAAHPHRLTAAQLRTLIARFRSFLHL